MRGLCVPVVQRIAKQVLEALVFIHEQGLIHCDLKPENILIKSYSRSVPVRSRRPLSWCLRVAVSAPLWCCCTIMSCLQHVV